MLVQQKFSSGVIYSANGEKQQANDNSLTILCHDNVTMNLRKIGKIFCSEKAIGVSNIMYAVYYSGSPSLLSANRF